MDASLPSSWNSGKHLKKIVLLTALTSASVLAQVSPPPPPPHPEPMAADSPPAPPLDSQPREDPGGRIRWGASGNLGWHIPSFFTFGAEVRAGYQFSNILSAYGVLGGTVGVGFGWNAPGDPTPAAHFSGLSHLYVGAIGELVFGDSFYVGGGVIGASGTLVNFTGAASSGVVESTSTVAAGFIPGIDLRLGFGFGSARAPSFRRGGFNIGLDARMLFYPNALVVRTRYDGNAVSAAVETRELAVTLIPMLMLGYDSR